MAPSLYCVPGAVSADSGAWMRRSDWMRTSCCLSASICRWIKAYRDATTQWAIDTVADPDAVPTLADLLPYIRYERLCLTDGVYTLAPAGQNPTYSRETLPLFPHLHPP